MIKYIVIVITTIAVINIAHSRNYINIVGSSTVFPFSTVVAETFGKKTTLKTPKVEATGSGGGMKLFCKSNGINTPDITNSSRRIKVSELTNCQKNGVVDISEVLIGFDGIVLANSNKSPKFDLTLRDLYLALAAKVPTSADDNTLINNPYISWNQINPKLPNYKIKVLGPPPTSGTRDALQELAIEAGCKTFKFIAIMQKTNEKKYKALCRTIREDGLYVEMGENDNLIISKLNKDKQALGIFGFSFLEENLDVVQGSMINSVDINFENIVDGSYPISRPLYVYIKNSHRDKITGLNKFIAEFVNEGTIGEEGYLVDKGLIPLPNNMRIKMAKDAKNAVTLKLKIN